LHKAGQGRLPSTADPGRRVCPKGSLEVEKSMG
jgi:hypothetical protein